MKTLLVVTAIALLAGCNPITDNIVEAEKYCAPKGGISHFSRWNQVICKDGSVVW